MPDRDYPDWLQPEDDVFSHVSGLPLEQPEQKEAPEGIAVHQAVAIKPEEKMGARLKNLLEKRGTIDKAVYPYWKKEDGSIDYVALACIAADALMVDDKSQIADDKLTEYIKTELGTLATPTAIDHAVKYFRKAYGKNVVHVQKAKRKLIVESASDLMDADVGETAYTVQGILSEGFAVLGGAPKMGKSWLALDLAISVAQGTKFLNHQTLKGNVLYLAVEDGRRRLKKRLKAIGYDKTIKGFDFADPKSVDTIAGELLDQIDDWVSVQPNPRLVILDTVGRLKGTPKLGNNSYEVDTALYAKLQEYAIQKHITILGVTHLKKESKYKPDDDFERITGSTGLPGVCDTMMMITGKRFSEEPNHILITGRDMEEGNVDLSAKFNKDTKRWQILGDSEDLEEQRQRNEYAVNSIVQTVKRMISEQGQWIASSADIIEKAMSFGYQYPGNEKKVGRDLSEKLIEQMYVNDSICTTRTRTNKTRAYTFSRK